LGCDGRLERVERARIVPRSPDQQRFDAAEGAERMHRHLLQMTHGFEHGARSKAKTGACRDRREQRMIGRHFDDAAGLQSRIAKLLFAQPPIGTASIEGDHRIELQVSGALHGRMTVQRYQKQFFRKDRFAFEQEPIGLLEGAGDENGIGFKARRCSTSTSRVSKKSAIPTAFHSRL
jgi:hypothetical protein